MCNEIYDPLPLPLPVPLHCTEQPRFTRMGSMSLRLERPDGTDCYATTKCKLFSPSRINFSLTVWTRIICASTFIVPTVSYKLHIHLWQHFVSSLHNDNQRSTTVERQEKRRRLRGKMKKKFKFRLLKTSSHYAIGQLTIYSHRWIHIYQLFFSSVPCDFQAGGLCLVEWSKMQYLNALEV